METLRCTVHRITFHNDENGWTVIKGRVRGYDEPVAMVGTLGKVSVGASLLVKGEWVNDKKFGRQFSVGEYEELLPATAQGIEKYLGSGLIKGIGPKFAKRIVKQFGSKTLDIIEDDPDRLLEVEGLGQNRIDLIKEAWVEQKEVKNIILFLSNHDVGSSLAYRIYNEFGKESITIVKENPYKLTEIKGIGFITADTVAQKMGFDKDSIFRRRSGIAYTLNESSNDGHCFLSREELVKKAAERLEVDEAKIDIAIDEMLLKKELILEPPDSLYIPPLFFSESGTARRIHTILSGSLQTVYSNNLIDKLKETTDISYNAEQQEAIRLAVESKMMILTGGPGTGKTTTVKGIITVYRGAGSKILLAAPTGRAAKRLAETTGLEVKTIHRLLEAIPPDGYKRNEGNKLTGDVIIIDESSMIDIVLMYNLLKAIPDEMTVIFVGDADQLPSVGPGNVLLDMIESGVIQTVKLIQIFRQAMESDIIRNAHCINKGEFPDISNKKGTDFFFDERSDDAELPNLIVDLCANRLPKFYNVKPSDIQVLTPMQRGDNGALNLNAVLQKALNHTKKALYRGGIEFKQGDKVMQIKNNYDKEVWNGDIGIVKSINIEERSMHISFDDNEPIQYEWGELDELTLAYATTVHKAQGSEYNIVIIPMTTQHYKMLQRNLLYTGITRARKTVVIIGTKKAIKIAINNDRVTKRNTGLAMRLINKLS